VDGLEQNQQKGQQQEEEEEEEDSERRETILRDLWRRDWEQQEVDDGMESDTYNGQCGEELKEMDYERGGERRKLRLEQIVKNMVKKHYVDKNALDNSLKKNASSTSNGADRGEAKSSTGIRTNKNHSGGNVSTGNQSQEKNSKANSAMGFKLVVDFQMENVPFMTHLGGIHFCAPPQVGLPATEQQQQYYTPHVYTTCGIIGDHQGTRCWVPTIDTASSKHRATHELTVRVTADSREGLWPVGCGEHFGVSKTYVHSMPKRALLHRKEDIVISHHDSGSQTNQIAILDVNQEDQQQQNHPQLVKESNDADRKSVV
jgi:hypothetical protein